MVVAWTAMVAVMPHVRRGTGSGFDEWLLRLIGAGRSHGDPSSHLARHIANRLEQEHPAAPHPEVAAVLDQRGKDVDPKDEKSRSDDAGHHLVDAFRKTLPDDDGNRPQCQHHQRMPEGVEGTEKDRLASLVLRACYIGDRCDVVPVDPVTEAESESGYEEPE